uniref:Activin_recp domain-containing protein n=1 Tax=Parastrongyloides trichosuri TaxID=131310 RepID=A0A0N4ZNP4_PARTI
MIFNKFSLLSLLFICGLLNHETSGLKCTILKTENGELVKKEDKECKTSDYFCFINYRKKADVPDGYELKSGCKNSCGMIDTRCDPRNRSELYECCCGSSGQQTGVAGFNKIREIETCNKSYCYNATSTVGGILNFIKSGCGEKRCLATQLPKIPTFLSKLNISILKGYDEITRTGCYHTDIDGKPGTKLTLGQLEETVECPNKRYCYKIVAKSGLLVNLVHAGCGDKRCFVSLFL